MSQEDIFTAISANPINNGGLVVNIGSSKFYGATDKTTSYINQSIPNIASLSGKYIDRFDDKIYY